MRIFTIWCRAFEASVTLDNTICSCTTRNSCSLSVRFEILPRFNPMCLTQNRCKLHTLGNTSTSWPGNQVWSSERPWRLPSQFPAPLWSVVGPLISCCPLNIGRPPDQPDLGTCEQQGISHHPAPLMLRSNSRVSAQINNGPLIGQYNLLVHTVGHILHVEHSVALNKIFYIK